MYPAKLLACTAAAVLCLNACGGDDEDFAPVEILYFVQGPTGAQFEIVQEPDPFDPVTNPNGCRAQSRDQISGFVPSGGFGFQTRSATHVLPGIFEAPHYFIFENEVQPTRAVIRNLSDTTITVQQLRGLAPPASTLETRTIQSGECRSVSTFSDDEERCGVPDPDQPDTTPRPCLVGPVDSAREYRVEVCSFLRGTNLPDNFECQDLVPRGTTDLDADGNPLEDIGAAFLGTVGDLDSSFLTRCLQLENSEQVECRTPSTFYLFDPADIIGIAMTRLGGQVDSFLQVDLYRGDRRIGSNTGTGDVFIREEL